MKVLSHKLYKKPGQGYFLNGCLHLVTKSLTPEISFTQYQGPAEAKYSEIWLAVTATK